ncbi:MAG: Cys/Met metabolism pyridoxal-phosphate-dependent protein [Conexibacter sp.]|nr:Cys/Met metabolism pyridoxal-phosphate-dependent protein [Conexibacter sp.]
MTAGPRDVSDETWAVLGGRGRQAAGDPLNVGPVLASNFVHGDERYYSREHATETWEAFEALLGGWERGDAVAFSSGMAAVAAVFDLLPVGASVVLPDDCYQRVMHLAEHGGRTGRWMLTRLAVTDTKAWRSAARTADLLWLESPSNPLLAVADVPAICAAPRRAGTLVAVDNTLATPLAQRPLELGADLAVHSATKFIGGHADLLLGVAAARSPALSARLRERRALAGAVPGALETFLALRGARTLPLRLRQATATAQILAERLAAHPEVELTRYPGLPDHPTHAVAAETLGGPGAMISFDVRGGADRADALCRSLRIIHHATSLGGVESTIERRASHHGQEHLPPSLVRLSVGCEQAEDLWGDLADALAATGRRSTSRPG